VSILCCYATVHDGDVSILSSYATVPCDDVSMLTCYATVRVSVVSIFYAEGVLLCCLKLIVWKIIHIWFGIFYANIALGIGIKEWEENALEMLICDTDFQTDRWWEGK
jgi:hypothetical protein